LKFFWIILQLLSFTRSSSASALYSSTSSASALYSPTSPLSSGGNSHVQEKLNYSFPGGNTPIESHSPGQYSPNCDGAGETGPYISSSVMLPASSGGQPNLQSGSGLQQPSQQGGHHSPKDETGFYQNVTARFRQANVPPPASITGFRQSSQAMSNGSINSTSYSRNSRDEQFNRNSYSRNIGSADHLQHKSPKTQELEEFAAKFEGYQKQRSRRNLQQPTPMLDQLARESQVAAGAVNFSKWLPASTGDHQLTALETNLLKLVQRNDSFTRRASGSSGVGNGSGCNAFSEDSSSGRESVTTVISNCSNETLKYTDRHSSCETLRFSDNGDQQIGGCAEMANNGGDPVDSGVGGDHEWLGGEDMVNKNPHEAVTSEYCDESSVLHQDRYGDYMNMSSSSHQNSWKPAGYNQDPGKRMLSRSLSESTSNHGDRMVFNESINGDINNDYAQLQHASNLVQARGNERPSLASPTSSSHLSDKLAYLTEAALRSGNGRLYYGATASHPDWADYVPPEGHGIGNGKSNGKGDLGLPVVHSMSDFQHIKESYAAGVERSLRNTAPSMRSYESSSNLNYGRSGEPLFGSNMSALPSTRGASNSFHKRKEDTLLRSASEVTVRSFDEPQMMHPAGDASLLRRNGLQHSQIRNTSPTSYVSTPVIISMWQ
jgi:hypothetical protein